MALNVVMLGASRSGKTSILASMLHNVCNPYADNRVNQYFCVKDVSEYAALDRGRRKEVRLPSNVAGMQELLRSPENGTDYVPKMPNLFGTSFPFTYTFNIKAHINSFISSKYITINYYEQKESNNESNLEEINKLNNELGILTDKQLEVDKYNKINKKDIL